jgi:hypothetical protein
LNDVTHDPRPSRTRADERDGAATEVRALRAECERLAAESARARADLAAATERATRLEAERARLAATVDAMTGSRLWRAGERWWRLRATLVRAARRLGPGRAPRA